MGITRQNSQTTNETALRSKLLQIAVATIVVVSPLFALSEPAHACECGPLLPPLEALREATAVFRGEVVGVRDYSPAMIDGLPTISLSGPVAFEFRVKTIWKGSLPETVFVTTVRSEATCGFDFAIGSDYVVYAYGEPIELRAGLCSRKAPAWYAQEDFDALGEGRHLEPGTSMATPTPGPTPEPAPTPTPTPTPEPTPIPTPIPTPGRAPTQAPERSPISTRDGLPTPATANGTCAASVFGFADVWPMTLIAGFAWLAIRKRRR